jgi:putative aldouronate transport system substrate-binding protein
MKKSIENAQKYPWKNASDGYLSSSDTYTEKGGQLDSKVLQTVLQIIAGKQPVSGINDAIAEWKRDGGDKIIEEVNAAYQAGK